MTNRTLIAAIGVSLAAAAITASAGLTTATAHADPGTDAQFLEMLAEDGFNAGTGSQGLITAGHYVCAAMAPYTGSDEHTLIVAGYNQSLEMQRLNPALTLDAASQFVATAIVALCPWDAPQAATNQPGTVT